MLTISLSVTKKNGKYNKERSYTKKSAPRMYFFCTWNHVNANTFW